MALSMAKEKEKSSNVVVTKASTKKKKKISSLTLHPVDDISDYLCNLNAKN